MASDNNRAETDSPDAAKSPTGTNPSAETISPAETNSPDETDSRQGWLPECISISVVMVVTLLLAWLTPIDRVLQRWFYDAHAATSWPYADIWICRFFYYAAPVIVGLLAAGTLAFLLYASIKPNLRRFRIYGYYILLCALLGPGLVVNALLKDYTGRPRPRQTIEFGGTFAHHMPLEFGEVGKGKSFPAGHASVGFLLSAGYFLLRRRHRKSAQLVLLFSLMLGAGMGVCRIAAGAHFFSDVVFAGAITFGVNGFIYHTLLKIPRREAAGLVARSARFNRWEAMGYGGFAVLTAGMLLLAYPYHNKMSRQWPETESLTRPVHVTLTIDRGEVVIDFRYPERHLWLEGEIYGFGLPQKEVRREFDGTDTEHLSLVQTTTGIFTEFEGVTQVYLDPARVLSLSVHAPGRDITTHALPDTLEATLNLQNP